MRSASRADLVEIGRDEKDRGAGLFQRREAPVNEVARRDIDASRRLTDDQAQRAAPHLAGADELLLVASRQVCGRRFGIRRAHIVLFHRPPRRLGQRAWCGNPAACERWSALVAENKVFFAGEFGDQCHAEPVFGDMGEPEPAPSLGIEGRRLVPGDAQRTARRDHAGNRRQELGLAVSRHAGDPDDLAGADREVTSCSPGLSAPPAPGRRGINWR